MSTINDFQGKFKESIVIALKEDNDYISSISCSVEFASYALMELIKDNPNIGMVMSELIIKELMNRCDKSDLLNDILISLKDDIDKAKADNKLN